MTTFLIKAENGKPNFGSDFNRARFYEYLKEHEGKQLRISPVEEKRSLSQNNYYFNYLGVVEYETGNSANDLHELFKRTLLPPKFIKVMGKEIKIPASTTELSKTQFADYLDKICAETNVPLPEGRCKKCDHADCVCNK